jgi:hypothetical protein
VSRRSSGGASVRAAGRPCTVTVCRGCCCGSPKRGADAVAAAREQAELLRAAAGEGDARFELRVSDCLGPCDHADVVVVQPSTAGRLRGGRPVWIGWSTAQGCTDDLLAWVAAGGPGLAPLPPALELQTFRPPRAGLPGRRESATARLRSGATPRGIAQQA